MKISEFHYKEVETWKALVTKSDLCGVQEIVVIYEHHGSLFRSPAIRVPLKNTIIEK